MLFWLKKALSFWLMPLPCSLALMIAGLGLLGFSRGQGPRCRRLGRGLLVGGVLLLLFFSNHFVGVRLLRPLESRYPPVPELGPGPPPAALARCQYVVVLGGGHAENPALSATNQLSVDALARVMEGVRLARALPAARLVVTGPGAAVCSTHAAVLAQSTMSLGVDAARIIRIEQALDTEEESQAVRQLAGDAPVALVTSAWHMPRAFALFRGTGADVLPCPTGILAKSGPGWSWRDILCDSSSLECSTAAVHEWLGLLWVWLRGKG